MKDKQKELTIAMLFVIASLLVFASIMLPYWKIWIAAPQYPKGLNVIIYVTGAKGDVREVDGLNHYIGMRPLGSAAPFERKIAVPGISAIAACLFVLAFLRKKWALVLLLPALALPFVCSPWLSCEENGLYSSCYPRWLCLLSLQPTSIGGCENLGSTWIRKPP